MAVLKNRTFRGRELDASYTVEAVFIVPFVSVLIVILVNMALYLRDVSAAEALAERVAEDARALILNDEEPRKKQVMYERKLKQSVFQRWFVGQKTEDANTMTEYLRELCEDRFWISRAEFCDVEIDGSEIRVRIRLVSDSEIPALGTALSKRWFSDEICRSIRCVDVPLRTRIYAAVMESGSQVKGIGTVLEKLSEIVNRLKP